MRTAFSDDQRADPAIRHSEAILRACVHCGFCTATCPTYQLLGDELDGPRGRIYLIKDMLESEAPPAVSTVTHLDRCLTCLACATTCPSGVDYGRLIDRARVHIEKTHARPSGERSLRELVVRTVPHPRRFALAMAAGVLAKPFKNLMSPKLRPFLEAATRPRGPADRHGLYPAKGKPVGRVALWPGCAQKALTPRTNKATRRLLTRHGLDVVVPDEVGCCGALVQHMGLESEARDAARRNIDALEACEAVYGRLDAVVVTASGCGSTLKDYGHLLADDARTAGWAGRMRDLMEVLADVDLTPAVAADRLPRLAVHVPCSLQHGQKLPGLPAEVLGRCGFDCAAPKEAHLCCGSAGAYSLLQPDLSERLRVRKTEALAAVGAGVVATGNVGCQTHLARGGALRVVHWAELMDWATGGPPPKGMP